MSKKWMDTRPGGPTEGSPGRKPWEKTDKYVVLFSCGHATPGLAPWATVCRPSGPLGFMSIHFSDTTLELERRRIGFGVEPVL
jgi:hypothetical protein